MQEIVFVVACIIRTLWTKEYALYSKNKNIYKMFLYVSAYVKLQWEFIIKW